MLVVVEGQQHVAGIPAGTEHLPDLVFLAAAFRDRPDSRLCLGAVVILAEPEVDDTAHRIRSVQRGRAVWQYFDAIDCGQRDIRHVREDPFESTGSDAAPVHQHERRRAAEPAQIDRVAASDVGRRIARDIDIGFIADAAPKNLGKRAHDFLRSREARAIDVIAVERDHFRADRALETADVRTHDHDLIELHDVRAQRGLRRACSRTRIRVRRVRAPAAILSRNERDGTVTHVPMRQAAASKQNAQTFVDRMFTFDSVEVLAADLFAGGEDLHAGLFAEFVNRRGGARRRHIELMLLRSHGIHGIRGEQRG